MTNTLLYKQNRVTLNCQGFSLVEFMISILIGLFIILGVTQIFLSAYSASVSEKTLEQYRDNQRIALIMLTNVIQSAGYFYNPVAQTATAALPPLTNADASVFTAGTGIVGTGGATGTTAANSDTINIYFLSSGSDGLYNCQGGAAAVPTGYVNSFAINANNQLECSVTTVLGGVVTGTSTALTLATGVKSMTILYGVDVAGSGTVGSYLSANAVQAAGLWGSVRTAQITLNFIDPNVINPAVSLTTVTSWVQTINLMRQS